MPIVFWSGSYRFHFVSNEGDPREPVHVHVTRLPETAKFWLWPEVNVAYNKGYTARELARLSAIVEARREEIEEAWNDHFA